MVVSGELNNGREAEGWMAGKGFMKKMSEEGEQMKWTLIWATQGS